MISLDEIRRHFLTLKRKHVKIGTGHKAMLGRLLDEIDALEAAKADSVALTAELADYRRMLEECGRQRAHDVAQMLRLQTELEGRQNWLIQKLKQLRKYEPPTDGRSSWEEIQGWMHVLVFTHNLFQSVERDRNALRAKVARLTAERFSSAVPQWVEEAIERRIAPFRTVAKALQKGLTLHQQEHPAPNACVDNPCDFAKEAIDALAHPAVVEGRKDA